MDFKTKYYPVKIGVNVILFTLILIFQYFLLQAGCLTGQDWLIYIPKPPQFICIPTNGLFLIILNLVMILIFQQVARGIVVSTALCIFFCVAGNIKNTFLPEPISWSDFYAVKDGWVIIGPLIRPWMYLLILPFLGVLWGIAYAIHRAWPFDKFTWRTNKWMLLALLISVVLLPLSIYTNMNKIQAYRDNLCIGKRLCRMCGVPAVILNQAVLQTFKKTKTEATPENLEKLQHLIEGDTPSPTLKQRPHIVILVFESMANPGLFAPGDFSKVTPNYHRAAQEGQHFTPLCAIVGGNSIFSEFEILTGFPCVFITANETYRGTYPMQTQRMPSFPSALRAYGYRSCALMPVTRVLFNYGDFFQKSLGFDESYFVDDLFGAPGRPLGSDAQIFAKIDQKLRQNPDTPHYIFVNLQDNHAPYFPRLGVPDSVIPPLDTTLSVSAQQEFKAYLQGCYQTDLAFGAFLDSMRNLNRDVILLGTGDHQPPFAEELRQRVPKMNYEVPCVAASLIRSKKNPYTLSSFFWTNQKEINFDPIPNGIGLPYVNLYLARAIGLTHPYYTDFLGQVQDSIYAVLPENILYHPSYGTQKEKNEWVRRWDLLFYDVFMEKKQTYRTFFPAPNLK